MGKALGGGGSDPGGDTADRKSSAEDNGRDVDIQGKRRGS